MDQNQPQYGEDAEEEYALQQHDVLGQVRLVLPPVLLRVLLKLISGSSGRLSSLLRIAAADADVDVDVDAFPLEFLVVSFAFSSSTTAAATTELPEAAARPDPPSSSSWRCRSLLQSPVDLAPSGPQWGLGWPGSIRSAASRASIWV
eukprot:CAMPEP_0167808948 /NCGR_PEP_ID=MMETSP0111_2-20121227/23499_1 /TAXON_ID=91324 /ORGANISM="Lotharella globosa, Strain CCCM811" /LENGTH=146 /DNA_ID=CAMNT_0007707233 /DNA_START=361 /DNA_END=799 /DNA_ORIENTATION=+